MLEFRILGPLEAARAGQDLRLASSKQRAVLSALILQANQVASTDALIEAVWGDSPPATAGHALQVYISALRRVLEPHRGPDVAHGVLLTRSPGYLLRVESGQLDSDRFENLTAQARAHLASGSAETAADLLRDALALWRGPALAELKGFDPADREAARLEELRQSAIEARIDADLARGLHTELVGELRSTVMEHPFRERGWAQLMLALYRTGRQQHALAAYQELRQLLHDELGVEPAPAVQRLHQSILNQRPHLDWVRASVSEPDLPAGHPLDHPDTRYVQYAGANIAYQAFGNGAVDLVFLPGYVSHLEVRWEEPRLAKLYRRLASSARLIMIDKRGSGLSDRSVQSSTPDQHIGDIAAVMNAIDSERAVFLGVSDGGVLALLFAAAHPERVAGVITYAAYAAFDPPASAGGHSAEFLRLRADLAARGWILYPSDLERMVQVMAPGRAAEADFIRWVGRYARLSAGPGGLSSALQAMAAIDVRHLLPTLDVPTLVLHRSGDRVVPPATARYLAEHLSNARRVELPGDDNIIWAGDVDAIADEVERFIGALDLGSDRFA